MKDAIRVEHHKIWIGSCMKTTSQKAESSFLTNRAEFENSILGTGLESRVYSTGTNGALSLSREDADNLKQAMN